MSPLFYEVTATVREDLRLRYETFLREKHVRDVLATGAFANAVLERAEPGRIRVRYEAVSAEALERYRSDHAPRLRLDVLAHFPDGVEFARETWSPIVGMHRDSGPFAP